MKYIDSTLFIILLFLSSCRTTTDTITYFQNIEEFTNRHDTIYKYAQRIVPDDQLSIMVSGIDPQSVAAFNMPLSSYMTPGETRITNTPVLHTYLVSSSGEISFPVLGNISVGGKTTEEVRSMLTKLISAYVHDPIVTVQIRNFKVTILGEVNKPGTITINNERLSILDAIGLAGDLTIYGNRSNIILIRENDGQKSYHQFDLTKIETLNSPYYYLQQNDVIYISPNKTHKNDAKYSQKGQLNISLASTLISAVSIITSLAIALLVK